MTRQLAQFGTTYLPVVLQADTSQTRIFTGEADPHSVAGVVLAVNDRWESVSTGVLFGFGNGGYGLTPYGS